MLSHTKELFRNELFKIIELNQPTRHKPELRSARSGLEPTEQQISPVRLVLLAAARQPIKWALL